MADSYDKIRDNILSHYRDPSFQEALSLSKELFLRECNVLSDRRLISNDAGDLSHSRPVDATSASSKRKGIELDSSESIKDSHPSSAGSNTFIAFNARHSRATTPSHSNRDFGLNNARPAYDDKEVASPKLASAIRNALGKSDTQVPTLDFAFKCFSVNGATKPSDSGRSEAHANHKSLGEPKHAKSCSSEPISSKFSDSNFKPASVSNRLSKFSSQSKNVAKSPTPACELSSGGDRRSASESATNYARELHVSQTPSNHSLNSWASKQENDIARVNSVEKDVSLGINSGSMFKHSGNGQFFSDKADDHVPQKHFIETPIQNVELEPNPEPPVSKSRFSDVIIVFISEHDDTIHVCPVVKCQFLGTIENKLKELNEQNALEHITNISVGEKYAAPFNGDWYRAEIVSANMKKKSVCVSFCDYGNEENIPLSDLRLLPEEFQDLEPLSFPIKLPKGAPAVQSGSKLKIRPLSLEEDWSWAVELRTSPQ
ncbi:hypothetical protein GE061_012526 [Apolygus lucorum]|uniref:Tudor domain-containing protein n=1 Tax=Apolygus lucorum TaxID=248454 RepID=A0A8S9XUU2_APOLU|nr:hypothetical protein GE061_012526 [Apolygus lucorum]